MMNILRKYKVYFIAAITSFVTLWWWQGKSKSSVKKQGSSSGICLSMPIAIPHKATVQNYIETVGQSTPFNRVVIVPQIEGTLLDVKFPNGGQVQAGTHLFSIDSRTFEAFVKQSEAQLAIDRARYELNLSQMKRSEGLHSSNFLSQQEYDSYKANVDTSKAQMDLDEATCALKRIDLEHCFISAPFSGMLSKSFVDANSFITKGTALAVLNQLQPIFVDAYLAEQHVVSLLKAQNDVAETLKVEARLIDDPSVVQWGKLVVIGNEVEKTSGTFDIRAQFENQELQFWAGRGVDLKIYYKTLQNALLIPESAIHQGNKGSFVYIVNDKNIAEMRNVAVEQSYDGWIVIAEGLKGDEKVIAEGHTLLAPGMPIQVLHTVTAPETLK